VSSGIRGGPASIAFGELDGSRSERASRLLGLCIEAGVEARISDDIRRDLWSKFAFICAQAGMTSAVRLPIGEIRSTPESMQAFRAIAAEACMVAKAIGVRLPADTADRHTAFAEQLEPGGFSSLHHDMAHGNPMELEALPRSHTIALRAFYLWPRAWHLFKQSPLIGTGFGSYNDLPYRLEGSLPLVQVNRPPEPVFSDAHAHHTFLHVLAETGLLGFVLLVFLLVKIYRFIRTLPEDRLRVGFELVFWIAVLSSLTEHRLFTPSQMLPFTIILGLAVAREEYRRWRERQDVSTPTAVPARPLVSGVMSGT
jgi:hypothetical protein